MNIIGQNNFLEHFHSDSPNVSFDLEYYDVQSIEKGYPTESFSQLEILEKQLRFKFSKLSQKVVWLPWQQT